MSQGPTLASTSPLHVWLFELPSASAKLKLGCNIESQGKVSIDFLAIDKGGQENQHLCASHHTIAWSSQLELSERYLLQQRRVLESRATG